MEDFQIVNMIVYLILIIIFGYIFGHYLSKKMIPLREGARTLPRPVINPRVSEYEIEKTTNIPIPGETINKMIDRFIFKYFDKNGFPLESTIALYSKYCCNKGNVTQENKRKLTDIGYYILDIVIFNIPSTNTPNPKEYWPPIKWSNHNIFNILIQPTNTAQIIRGQNYRDEYVQNYTGSSSTSNFWSDLFGNDSGFDYGSNGSNNNNNDNNNNNQETADSCSDSPQSRCGIGCPTSCLSSAFAAALPPPSSSSSSSSGNNGYNENGNESGIDNTTQNTISTQKSATNTTFLPGGINEIIIGSANIDGYQITDCLQKSDGSELNDMINDFIKTYFIEGGPNENRPTQTAIDLFNKFQNKTPMDGFHMNKMRDLIFYVLQVIIPGLPTRTYVSGTPARNKSDSSYVEWRPIRWLSLSEQANQ